MAAQTWLSRNIAVYVDNPTATRDFRAQLRGNKAIALWSLYLFVMMGFTLINYYTISQSGSLSVTDIQFRLRSFYESSMYMLAAAICLITPSLTAGSIVVERQRKSLDLLFSAPVSLKGMLVGKMIAAYRYTLMLLILSIPMTSVAVVMGGATWSDVLQAYAILSFGGLVLTSIGLLISSLSESVGAAVIWTYLASGLYLWGISAVGVMITPNGPSPSDMPFLIGMNPFFAVMTGPTRSPIAGFEVPNWILVGIVSILMCRLFLLGTASHLSPFGSKETQSFRVQTALYFFVGLLLVGSNNRSPFDPAGVADAVAILCVILVVFMPNILSYAKDGGRKFGYDGPPRIDSAFNGARSGSLAYLMLLWLSITLGVLIAILISVPNFALGMGPQNAFVSNMAVQQRLLSAYIPPFLDGAVWTFGFLFMFWGLARGISARAKTLKGSRSSLICAMVLFLGLPLPLLSMATSKDIYGENGMFSSHLWAIYLAYPFAHHLATAPIYAGLMVVIGLAGFAAERERLKQPVISE